MMVERRESGDYSADALARLEQEVEESLLRQLEAESDDGITEETKTRIREELRARVREEIEERIGQIKDEIVADVLAPEPDRVEVEEEAPPEEEEKVLRLGLNFRLQHILLFASVLTLILTGLPLRFAEMNWSGAVIGFLGGIENSRVIHRIAASGLMIVAVWHMLYTAFSKDGRWDLFHLLPRPRDVLDLFTMLMHFFGRTDERPRFGRFSYIEKFDYWAVYWGCVIMIGTGLILWFQDLSLKFLPKFVLDISKEAHRDEALLATLAIIIWHFYNVHFNPDRFPGSLTWLTGKITKHQMMEEHPLEYEEIMAAQRLDEDQIQDDLDDEIPQRGRPSENGADLDRRD